MTRENDLKLLWLLLAARALLIPLALAGLVPPAIDVTLTVFLPAVFALVHGAVRYRLRGILVFLAVCLVVSNLFENLSILTGFPFGHYYYTDELGPKLFLVPLLIGPAYFGTGYLSWVLSTVVVGEVRRGTDKLTTFGVPFVASFIMVSWDVCFDPDSSTLLKEWIWEQGGGYFGVPITNYLGWFFTVYLFLQLFALYLRADDPAAGRGSALPAAYWYQAVLFYSVIAVQYPVAYLFAGGGEMTDPTGTVWSVGAYRETAAIISLYTMFFAAALAAVKIAQRKGTPAS